MTKPKIKKENTKRRPKSGTAPNTSLWLDDVQRAWLQSQGGIQPTIRRLIDEAMRDTNDRR